MLGDEVISCLFSRLWTDRETAVRRLEQLSKQLLVCSEQLSTLQQCFADILAHVLKDAVYKVFVAALVG
jgi:hypothetical protein